MEAKMAKYTLFRHRPEKLMWDYPTDGPIRSSPKIAEGHVFIGSDDYNLYALNISTYQKSWSIHVEGAVRSTPFLTNDMIYFGTEGNEFICADYRGQVKWKFWAKRPITSSPIVSEGIVYFASVDSNLYALDASTGWVIWRFRMGKGFRYQSGLHGREMSSLVARMDSFIVLKNQAHERFGGLRASTR